MTIKPLDWAELGEWRQQDKALSLAALAQWACAIGFDFARHASYMHRLSSLRARPSHAQGKATEGSGRAIHLTQKAAGHGLRFSDDCALCGLLLFGGATRCAWQISAGFPA